MAEKEVVKSRTRKGATRRADKTPEMKLDGSSDLKLAERIAKSIERYIIETGWPVGESLGNEETLVKRFGVSRWVVREAIAITESDGLTEMRRGRHGGLVVREPAESVVATMIRNYLLFVGVRIEEIISARHVVDALAFRLGAERCSKERAQELRKLLQHPMPETRVDGIRYTANLYHELLDASGNPALRMLGNALSQLIVAKGIHEHIPEMLDNAMTDFFSRLLQLRRSQVESVLAGDAGRALAMQVDLDRQWLALFSANQGRGNSRSRRRLDSVATRLKSERVAELFQPSRHIKRAEVLSMQVQGEILANDLKPDDPLASEAELMQRFQVGRGVFRDAIRNLERHGFVRTEEGRNGGLRVGYPMPEATVRSVVLYLKFLRITMHDMLEIGMDLELAAVAAITQSVRSSGPECLKPLQEFLEALESGRFMDQSAIGHRLYYAMGDVSGNRILALLMRIMSAPVEIESAGSKPLPQAVAGLATKTRALVRAMEKGDAALAERYMLDLRQFGLMLGARERTPEELFGSI